MKIIAITCLPCGILCKLKESAHKYTVKWRLYIYVLVPSIAKIFCNTETLRLSLLSVFNVYKFPETSSQSIREIYGSPSFFIPIFMIPLPI